MMKHPQLERPLDFFDCHHDRPVRTSATGRNGSSPVGHVNHPSGRSQPFAETQVLTIKIALGLTKFKI